MTDLSIVMPSWNGRALVQDCLASIEREMLGRADADRLEVETIVVDNGSCDDTPAAVRERFPWARVLALPENRGFAAAVNAGLACARGRHAALLNNDTLLLPDALEACVRHLDAHPDVGVVGPQLLHPDRRKQNSIHPTPSLLTELVPLGVLETLFPRRYPSKRTEHHQPVEVEAILGACMVVRREVLDRVGPLPDDYFLFLEETDWLLQIRRAGWRVVHLPDARIVHLHGASSKRRMPLRTRIEYHRSLYHFFRKRRGRLQAGVVVALRLVRLLLALVLLAPLALVSPRQRTRWSERLRILGWHLCGRPASWGLTGVPAAGEDALR